MKKKSTLPSQYKAPKGSSRYKKLKRAAKLYKSGKKSAAFKLRNKMEESYARKKNSKKGY
jgi:hypothetical protein